MKRLDLTNKTFGRLTVIGPASKNRAGNITWSCLCNCGNTRVVSGDHLTRKTNPVKSCGCIKFERIGKNHHQWCGVGDISGGWWSTHILRERKQTTRPRIPVTLTKEEAWNLFLKQDRKCALTGINIVISNGSSNNASIDRIDSSRGYSIDNVQWVHKDVNFMKRTYVQEYFIHMCKLIAEKHK